MTDNIVEFTAKPKDADADTEANPIVTMLEEALEKAKSGDIVDIAICAVEREGEDDTSGSSTSIKYWGETNYSALVTAIDWCKFDMHYRRYQEYYFDD